VVEPFSPNLRDCVGEVPNIATGKATLSCDARLGPQQWKGSRIPEPYKLQCAKRGMSCCIIVVIPPYQFFMEDRHRTQKKKAGLNFVDGGKVWYDILCFPGSASLAAHCFDSRRRRREFWSMMDDVFRKVRQPSSRLRVLVVASTMPCFTDPQLFTQHYISLLYPQKMLTTNFYSWRRGLAIRPAIPECSNCRKLV
jgi:hypothetical protein